jgi:hypothetical protein
MSQSQFEKIVGLSNGYVNNIQESISPSKLSLILENFPELNLEWLLVGKGEMLKSTQHLENVKGSVAIGRDANDSKISVNYQEWGEFVEITKKNQEQTDRMLSIIEKILFK